jgi:agmatine deiminase
MKNLLLMIVLLLISAHLFSVNGTEFEIYQNPFLGHYLTPEEIDLTIYRDRDFYETDPPAGPVHNIAEFEAMQGVLIRYPFGLPYSLIAAMSEETIVTTIVSGVSQENTVMGIYNSNGVNTANCNFLYASSDSYWTRDYGPWFVIDGNGDFGIVNFPYNRPRPNDNDIPLEVAELLDIEIFGMNIYHTGGNYMTDGMGISASSDLVLDENPQLSPEEISLLMEDYLGVHTYHTVPDPNNTYIDHIDCWGKFLAVDKILIRSVPESHPQYDEIEAVVDYFAEQISSYGTPYQIFRVYTPNNQPYTNSLILNDRVYVPITNSNWDDEAIATYEEAMPGYEVLGFYSSSWESTDALHCRTKGIADQGMLYIKHIPLQGEQPANVELEISAEIIAYSDEALYSDSLLVYYKLNEDEYSSVPLILLQETTYNAQIPAATHQDSISYYIYAADESGRNASHPFIGSPDPHVFYIIQYPEMEVNITEIETVLQPDGIMSGTFDLANIGGGILEYDIFSIDTTENERDISGSYILCSADSYDPGVNVDWNFTVFNHSVDNEWLNQVILHFPEGVTVNSASNFTGGSGGELVYDEIAGDGVTVTWFGETSLGYGVIHGGETATATVNVTLDSDLITNIIIDYQINGDLYGNDPHSVNDQITITGLGDAAEWITLDPLSGEIAAGNYEVINYQIDAATLTDGIYTCDIIITGNAVSDLIIPVTLTVDGTSSHDNDIQENIQLLSNYPNPFNPETKIKYQVKNDSEVSIKIINMKGQIIRNLVNRHLEAGVYYQTWDGKDDAGSRVASGLYFYKLVTDKYQITEKMLLLK